MRSSVGQGSIRGGRGAKSARAALGWLGLAFAIAALLVVYLGIYGRNGLRVPIGADTTTYMWRAQVVRLGGLPALRDASPFPFDANGANPDRPGVPLLAMVVDRLLGIDPWSVPIHADGLGETAGRTLVVLGLLVVMGAGWSGTLFDLGPPPRVALAPSVGLGLVVVIGAAGGGVGLGPSGTTALILVTCVAGWFWFLVDVSVRRCRRGRGEANAGGSIRDRC